MNPQFRTKPANKWSIIQVFTLFWWVLFVAMLSLIMTLPLRAESFLSIYTGGELSSAIDDELLGALESSKPTKQSGYNWEDNVLGLRLTHWFDGQWGLAGDYQQDPLASAYELDEDEKNAILRKFTLNAVYRPDFTIAENVEGYMGMGLGLAWPKDEAGAASSSVDFGPYNMTSSGFAGFQVAYSERISFFTEYRIDYSRLHYSPSPDIDIQYIGEVFKQSVNLGVSLQF